MTIREEWVDTYDTTPWELYGSNEFNGEYKDRMKEVNPIYTEWLEQKANDYRLMLKALANGWEVWLGDNKWIWDDISEFDVRFEVTATQSKIPEINDELREEFKKI